VTSSRYAAPALAPNSAAKPRGNRLFPNPETWPIFIGVVLVGIGLSLAIQFHETATSVEEFDRQIGKWTKAPREADHSPVYVRGKVLPVLHTWMTNRTRGKYPAVDQELYWALPRDLRPSSADQVGTVLWLDWTQRLRTVAGPNQFTATIAAVAEICQVTVIDAKTNRKLTGKTFISDADNPPPGKPKPENKLYPEPPYEEIVAWLRTMPRKDD
jgi:hypothetical protein